MKKKIPPKKKTENPARGLSEKEINRREALKQMAYKTFGAVASLYGMTFLANAASASPNRLAEQSSGLTGNNSQSGAYYDIYYYYSYYYYGSYYNSYYYGSYYDIYYYYSYYYYGSYYDGYYYGSYYDIYYYYSYYYYGSYYDGYYYGSYYDIYYYYYGSYYNSYYYGSYYDIYYYYYGSYYNSYYYGSYYDIYYYYGSYYDIYYYYYNSSVIEVGNTGKSIRLAPDPVTNISVFDLKDLSDLHLEKIEIFDLQGKMIKALNIAGKDKVYIYRSDFKTGMYVYRIFSRSGKIFSDRFVVQ